MERDVGVAGLTHRVIDEYIASERARLRGDALVMFRKF